MTSAACASPNLHAVLAVGLVEGVEYAPDGVEALPLGQGERAGRPGPGPDLADRGEASPAVTGLAISVRNSSTSGPVMAAPSANKPDSTCLECGALTAGQFVDLAVNRRPVSAISTHVDAGLRDRLG